MMFNLMRQEISMSWIKPETVDKFSMICISIAVVLYIVLGVLHAFGLDNTTIGQLMEMIKWNN